MVLLVIPMVLIFAIFGTDALKLRLLKFNNVQSGNPAIYLIPEWHPILLALILMAYHLSVLAFKNLPDANLFVLLAYAGLGFL